MILVFSMHAISWFKERHIVGKIYCQYLLTTIFFKVPSTNCYFYPMTKFQCCVKYIIRAHLIALYIYIYIYISLMLIYIIYA